MRRIAIVGGGVAGIAAAHRLNQTGERLHVSLFEASDRLGGVLETIRDGPYLIERSADNFATMTPDAWQLTQDCGLAEAMIRPRTEGRRALVLHRGRLRPIPSGFSLMQPTRIGSVLTTRTLSWAGKLRLLGEYWVPRRTQTGDESLESFATRRLGREVFENLVEPIVGGIFTANPATLSMSATMPQFLEMERQHGGLIRGHLAARRNEAAAAARRASGARYDQFMAPREGMGWWVEQIANCLSNCTVRLETEVREVLPVVAPHSRPFQAAAPVPAERPVIPAASDSTGQHRNRGGSGSLASSVAPAKSTQPRWQLTDTNGTQWEFDAIICALPATAASRLTAELAPTLSEKLSQIPYASSAVVAMVVDRNQLKGRTDAFGLIVPQRERRQALAISFTSNKYPGRVPDDEILLRVFLGGALHPETVQMSDKQLTAVAARELREILGWQGNQANWQAVIRWNQAMPQYVLGHAERVQQIEEAVQSLPGFELCGAAYRGVGIPQTVRSGRLAAERILSELGLE